MLGSKGCAWSHLALLTRLPVPSSDALWPAGGYWDLAKQPSAQLEGLEPSWERILLALQRESLVTADAWLKLGEELHAAASDVDALLHSNGPSAMPKQTIIHGDPKAANFFFRQRSSHTAGTADTELPHPPHLCPPLLSSVPFRLCARRRSTPRFTHHLPALHPSSSTPLFTVPT